MSGIQHATNQSIKAFKSSEEYLYAMKEDLAEWLKDLYSISIDVNNILEVLETGAILCHHANNVTRVAEDFLRTYGQIAGIQLPSVGVTCVSSAQPTTFLARDNISNFINWCRRQLGVPDVLMFETDDLVLRKNEKHFILCLLEVARRASRFGMAAPVLIQLEQEIEEEIREEMDLPMEQTPLPKPQRRLANIQNLDEMVRCLISRCTCPTQFPMIKVSEGKYRVGDSSTLIFVRILRNHVMVRVGGGWDTLEHYLDKHDPCRCTSLSHKLAQRPSTPAVHEIKARVGTRQDGQTGAGAGAGAGTPTMLVLSRAQSPPQPVVWSTPGPGRGLRPSPAPCLSRSPDPGPRQPPGASPSRLRKRASTPGRRQYSESRDDSGLNASTRTGREAVRASPVPRHASSLPRSRAACLSPAPHREPRRSVTPHTTAAHTAQRSPGVQQQQQQHGADSRPNHTFTKSQLVTKLRQSAGPNDIKGGDGQGAPDRQRGHGPLRPYTPVQQAHPQNIPSAIKHAVTEDSHNSHRTSSGYSSTKGHVTSDGLPPKPLAQIKRAPSGHSGENIFQKKVVSDEQRRDVPNSAGNGSAQQRQSMTKQNVFHPAATGKAFLDDTPKSRQSSNVLDTTIATPGRREGFPYGQRGTEGVCLFTPPPITPDQEAILYQSLEHEILSNLQQLNLDYDDDESHSNSNSNNSVAEEVEEEEEEEEEDESDGQLSLQCPQVTGEVSNCQSMGSALRQEPASGTWSGHTKGGSGGGLDCVIGELQHGQRRPLEKVSVERWVNTLPFGSQRVQRHSGPAEADLSQPAWDSRSTQPACMASSWSSVGSSLEYRERRAEGGESGSALAPSQVLDGEEFAKDFSKHRRPRSSSFRQKRALRKPERVPSIYKLKLKPNIRPREDHRPNHKPSRIPKPVAYQRARESEGEGLGKGCTDNGLWLSEEDNRPRLSSEGLSAKTNDLKSRSVPQADPYRGFQGHEDATHVMEELESWV